MSPKRAFRRCCRSIRNCRRGSSLPAAAARRPIRKGRAVRPGRPRRRDPEVRPIRPRRLVRARLFRPVALARPRRRPDRPVLADPRSIPVSVNAATTATIAMDTRMVFPPVRLPIPASKVSLSKRRVNRPRQRSANGAATLDRRDLDQIAVAESRIYNPGAELNPSCGFATASAITGPMRCRPIAWTNYLRRSRSP